MTFRRVDAAQGWAVASGRRVRSAERSRRGTEEQRDGESRDPGSGCGGRYWVHEVRRAPELLGADDLFVDAVVPRSSPSAWRRPTIDTYWVGTMGSGVSGLTLSRPLRLDYKPHTGREHVRDGFRVVSEYVLQVASGAFDMVIATGVEKLKDRGFSGLAMGSMPRTVPRRT